MGSNRLNMALLFPRISAPSGGVEVTLKVIEHSSSANLQYTAFLSKDNILSPEVNRRLKDLAGAGLLEIRSLENPGTQMRAFDGAVVTSEFWMPALRKARRAALQAPLYLKFHQLPYVGTLDVLKAVGVDNPTPVDLARFPLVASKVLRAPVPYFAFQLGACALAVRALRRHPDAKLMAVTPVTSQNLRAFGYAGPVYVPRIHAGVDADELTGPEAPDVPIEYDGIYVGRFHPHKGFLDLPLIAAHLKRRLDRNVRIAVCGSPQVPRHLELFEKLARSYGVRENLVMHRYLSRRDLIETWRRSRVLLYPSYVDAFSITVLESLCLGVPIVAYGIDALRMIWGQRTGVSLAPVGDPEALAGLCARLEADGHLERVREAMHGQAAELRREYTWERAVACEREFYEGHWAANAAGR